MKTQVEVGKDGRTIYVCRYCHESFEFMTTLVLHEEFDHELELRRTEEG